MEAMDQPSIDGINVWYASKAASKLKLKVVFQDLEEMKFFGYNHFINCSFIFKYMNILKKIPFTDYFLKFLFKISAYIKKDDRLTMLSDSSSSIFNLWFLKELYLLKKCLNKIYVLILMFFLNFIKI